MTRIGSPLGARRGGFSLVELLIAVVILVFIMLAVASIFSNVSAALRLALGNSANLKGRLDVSKMLRQDLEGLNPDGFLTIVSMKGRAFQDAGDRDANNDLPNNGLTGTPPQFSAFDPSTGWGNKNADGVGGNNPTEGRGKRWYRCDLLSFWSSGYFRDTMGAQNPSNANEYLFQHPGVAATEAWITWGNMAVDTGYDRYNNSTGALGGDNIPDVINMTNHFATTPDGAKPNNLANEWSLARRVILAPGRTVAQLLADPSATASGGLPTPVIGLLPTRVFTPYYAYNPTIADSRYCSPGGGAALLMPDANITAWGLNDLYAAFQLGAQWQSLQGFSAPPGVINGMLGGNNPAGFAFGIKGGGPVQVSQIKRVMDLAYRPRGSLTVPSVPPSRSDVAKTTIQVAPRISDFVVEFAGDYLNQTATPDAWRDANQWRPGPDGVVDFMPMALERTTGSTTTSLEKDALSWPIIAQDLPNVQRFTMWYGAYRDGNGNNRVFSRSGTAGYRSDLAFDTAPVYARSSAPWGYLFFESRGNLKAFGGTNPQGFQTQTGQIQFSTNQVWVPFRFENWIYPGFASGVRVGGSPDWYWTNGSTTRGGYAYVNTSGASQLYQGNYAGSQLDLDNALTSNNDMAACIGRQTVIGGMGELTGVNAQTKRYSPGIGNAPQVGSTGRPGESLLVVYQAGFVRDLASDWPRLLRITYRVHSGVAYNDTGTLVSQVIRLPTSK